LLDLRDGTDTECLKLFLHPFDCPEQIDRSRTCLADDLADLVEVFLEIGAAFGFGVLHAERNAHGGSHPDRRRTAHHHVADDVRDLLVCRAVYVHLFSRQLRLIDEAHALVGPFEGLNHGFRRWSLALGTWHLALTPTSFARSPKRRQRMVWPSANCQAPSALFVPQLP